MRHPVIRQLLLVREVTHNVTAITCCWQLCCAAGNEVNAQDGFRDILTALLQPGASTAWINEAFVEHIDSDTFTACDAATLAAVAAAASKEQQLAELRSALEPAQLERALLVVVGVQNAGKTTLLWRLRHQNPERPMPFFQSTNGVKIRKCRVWAGLLSLSLSDSLTLIHALPSHGVQTASRPPALLLVITRTRLLTFAPWIWVAKSSTLRRTRSSSPSRLSTSSAGLTPTTQN